MSGVKISLDMLDLLTAQSEPDPLHEELQRYLFAHERLGHVLQHPLVYSVPHAPAFNRLVNKQFEEKKKTVDALRAAANWNGYIYMHERPYRLDAFEQVSGELDDSTYWRLLGSLWTGCENVHQCLQRWRDLWLDHRPKRILSMDFAERKELAKLPAILTVYRGFSAYSGEEGMSWTLSRDTAVWFANRYKDENDPAQIASGTVRKDNVLAHFIGRNEREIVVLPEDVVDMEVTLLSASQPGTDRGKEHLVPFNQLSDDEV